MTGMTFDAEIRLPPPPWPARAFHYRFSVPSAFSAVNIPRRSFLCLQHSFSLPFPLRPDSRLFALSRGQSRSIALTKGLISLSHASAIAINPAIQKSINPTPIIPSISKVFKAVQRKDFAVVSAFQLSAFQSFLLLLRLPISAFHLFPTGSAFSASAFSFMKCAGTSLCSLTIESQTPARMP
jgi:hypothetical protein